MDQTSLHVSTQFTVGAVSPLVFGGFLEHLGRAVYDGVYDPDSPHADADGCRIDVLEALRELDFSIVRYPGGNFVSGYHWQDGVGPRDGRPTVRELAWQSIEPNTFGTDEFVKLCRKLEWIPMMAANLGTGSAEEARNWVEYCNAPTGTRYSDMRAANGSAEPHSIRYWCLGNEMDGPWQLGHVPAEQYAIRAQQAAKMMKDVDGNLQTVVCGSSAPRMDTYLEWDRVALEHVGPLADYVSLHRYVGNPTGDSADFLAVGASIDQQIEAVDAVCRFVQAKQKSSRRDYRRAYLCFDEWNVWYRARHGTHVDGQGKFAPPLLEEVYNLEDALVTASFLMSFVRHADVVKIANLAQIVNVIAPILTRGDELLKQAPFYAFQMLSSRREGTALRVSVDGPGYDSASYGRVDYLDCAAINDPDKRELKLFAVNRHLSESLPLEVRCDVELRSLVSAELLSGAAPSSANSFDAPNQVIAAAFDGWRIEGTASAELPPLSLTASTFSY